MATDTGLSNIKKKRLQMSIIILTILVFVTGAVALALHLRVKSVNTSEPVRITQNVIGSTAENSQVESNENASESIATTNGGNANESADAGASTAHNSSEGANKGTYIELGKGNEETNQPFEMNSMLPGDCETKKFSLTVHSNEAVKVLLSAEKKNEEKNYADALDVEIKSADSGIVLFLGTFCDFMSSGTTLDVPKSKDEATQLNYTIKVSMNTEKDNRYQYGKLVADLKWSVSEEDRSTLEKIPSTGDTAMIYAIIGVAVVAAITMAICLSRSKKKEGDQQI